MHLFYDSTLNTFKLITERLPEKPGEINNAMPGPFHYLWDEYEAKIAALKQNALTVGNPEILKGIGYLELPSVNGEIFEWTGGYKTKEILSDGWVPSYNDPDNSGWHTPAEPITVAILTLPEEKKNTMENLTKEQQRVEFDKHRKEIEKIILGCRGIQSRQVHWSEAVPMVAMYITKELEKFSHPTTASGSVAAPKEETKCIPSLMANDAFALRDKVKQLKESISDLLVIAELYEKLPEHNKISKNANHIVIDRAKALLDK